MSAEFFADPLVFICAKCGRGFLTAQPNAIDQYPIWKVLSAETEGEICGGQIHAQSRNGTLKSSPRSTPEPQP